MRSPFNHSLNKYLVSACVSTPWCKEGKETDRKRNSASQNTLRFNSSLTRAMGGTQGKETEIIKKVKQKI